MQTKRKIEVIVNDDPIDAPGDTPDTASELTVLKGQWDAGSDFSVNANWELIQDAFNPYYLVSVEFSRQLVVTAKLNGVDKKGSHFSLRDPDHILKPIHGCLKVERGTVGDQNLIELQIQLSHEMADPGGFTTLNYYKFPIIDSPNQVYKPLPPNVPVRAPAITSVAPYCFAGQLKMQFKDKVTKEIKSFIGSATFITTKDPSKTGQYLLTAAHNLIDKHDGEAIKVTFVPGLNGQAVPPAELPVSQWHYPAGYAPVATSRKLDRSLLPAALLEPITKYDYALVKLKDLYPLPVSTAPKIAPFVNDHDLTADPNIHLCGLYGWNELKQSEMYYGTGAIDTAKLTPTQLQYNVSTRGGASGTAVTINHGSHIVGVHDGAGDGEYNVGHRLNAESIHELQNWQT